MHYGENVERNGRILTLNELISRFPNNGAKFQHNWVRIATVGVVTDRQTDRQTDRRDFIICPMLCYICLVPVWRCLRKIWLNSSLWNLVSLVSFIRSFKIKKRSPQQPSYSEEDYKTSVCKPLYNCILMTDFAILNGHHRLNGSSSPVLTATCLSYGRLCDFLGFFSRTDLEVTPLDRFWRKMAQTTWVHARTCHLE